MNNRGDYNKHKRQSSTSNQLQSNTEFVDYSDDYGNPTTNRNMEANPDPTQVNNLVNQKDSTKQVIPKPDAWIDLRGTNNGGHNDKSGIQPDFFTNNVSTNDRSDFTTAQYESYGNDASTIYANTRVWSKQPKQD